MDIQKISLERINKLHPKIKDEVKEAYLHINKKILGKGVRLLITQTLRTFTEQDELYNKKPKISNAKGGQSFHNYGLAFDIVLFNDKNFDGDFESINWIVKDDFDKDGQADWMEVVKYFKSIGYVWGGDFRNFKDSPHFEKTFANSWQILLKKYNNKEFIKGSNYVTI